VVCSVFTAAHLHRELLGQVGGPSQYKGRDQTGRLSAAAGGTLVLQHIDDLSLMLQTELMRILRDNRYQMLGSDDYLTLTTRIVCSTRTDLHSLADAGLFRADLLKEISQQTLQTPPLRDRREDMTALTEHFLREAAMKTGAIPKRIPIETMEVLCGYDWPENVRELEALITRACALDSGVKLSAETVRPWLLSGTEKPASSGSEGGADMSLREMEQMLIESTFARYAGNRERTALALEIGLRTLSGKLRDYGYPPRGGPQSKKQKRAA
jgi:DNA-binding NtrC family response regulator